MNMEEKSPAEEFIKWISDRKNKNNFIFDSYGNVYYTVKILRKSRDKVRMICVRSKRKNAQKYLVDVQIFKEDGDFTYRIIDVTKI